MGIRISKQDRIFSKLIRERAGWKCERCGTQYEAHSAGLHASHIFSRRYAAIRWEPRNCVAHCFGCHQWYGGNPVLGGEWAKEHLGEEIIDDLRRRIIKPMKLTKADKEDIYAHLKVEYDAMLSKRASGKVGRIEFQSPYERVFA